MKNIRKWTAVLLAAVLAFSFGMQAFAASPDAREKVVSPIARGIDKVLGVAHDALFGLLLAGTKQPNIPDYATYAAADHPYLYKGTDGAVTGSGWSAGFAGGSIIPAAWRCDASGKSDPNGYCLNKVYSTGGYQWKLSKIYTDQTLNVLILSNGSDANRNGIADMLLFISVDGVGVVSGTVKNIRAGVEKALQPFGVSAEDILACNVSASHCHVGLDTQGMNARELVPRVLGSIFNPSSRGQRSLSAEMENTIVSQASACAAKAFGKMENGSLYFFETTPISGVGDKLDCGVQPKNTFSCFLFEGVSGEKTILANIGAHPTAYYNRQILFTDYPYLMRVAMQDAGYNFLFVQSAQANIGRPSLDFASDEQNRAADAWVKLHALTMEDWIERYGESYAKKNYNGSAGGGDVSEEQFEDSLKTGYLLAHHILDASTGKKVVSPTLEIRNTQTMLKLDIGLIPIGCVSGMFGADVVQCKDAKSGYAVMVETDYLAIGDDVVILTAPGELSPALLLGSDPEYTGAYKWTGKTSWTGEDWTYDTLTEIVRKATGDSDKTVLLYGITNDALGYIYPDVMMPQSLVGTMLFFNAKDIGTRGDMVNSVLLATSTTSASQLMDAYIRLVEDK